MVSTQRTDEPFDPLVFVLMADSPQILAAIRGQGVEYELSEFRLFVVDKGKINAEFIAAVGDAGILPGDSEDGRRFIFAAHRHKAADLFDTLYDGPDNALTRRVREVANPDRVRAVVWHPSGCRVCDVSMFSIRDNAPDADRFRAFISAPVLGSLES